MNKQANLQNENGKLKPNTYIATSLILCACFWGAYTQANPSALRARDMSTKQWSEAMSQQPLNMTVEFRERDEIPVNLTAEGDFIETVQNQPTYIRVKRNFWLKLRNQDVLISLDGVNFKPLNQVVTGQLSAGADAVDAGIPVNSIQILLQMFMKK